MLQIEKEKIGGEAEISGKQRDLSEERDISEERNLIGDTLNLTKIFKKSI